MAARRAHNPEVVGSSPTPAKEAASRKRDAASFWIERTRRVSAADRMGGKGAMDGPERLKPRPGRRQQEVADWKASPTPEIASQIFTGGLRRNTLIITLIINYY